MAETVNDYMETDLGNVAPNPRGEYSETAAYEYLDLVAYAGGSYLCIREEGTVTGTAPEKGKDTATWQEVSLPGELTPEYVAMHDDVVNKATSVAEDTKTVASDREQVASMRENVAALQEQTAQDAQEAEKNWEASAGFASLAEESRKAASESEKNIRMLVEGFDTHVEEQKQSAQEDITDSRQTAIKAIAAQQVSSANAVKAEGEKAIQQTTADAASTAADRTAITELASTVSEQASKVAQDTAQTASDKEETEAYKENAKESKEQAVAAADSVKGIVAQVQQNTEELIAKAPVMVETVTSYAGEDVCVTDSAEMPLQGMHIYGRSIQFATTGSNLFKITKTSETLKGITFDVRKDGTIKISGTNTESSALYVILGTFEVVAGQTYIFNNFYSLENSDIETYVQIENDIVLAKINAKEKDRDMYTAKEAGVLNVRFKARAGVTIDTTLSEMQINIGETVLPYEPYTGGKPSPSPDYPQEIQSAGYQKGIEVGVTGKNLFDFSKLNANYGLNVKDKTITIPPKINNVGYYNSLKELCPGIKVGDTYVLSAKTSNPEALRTVHLMNANVDFDFGKAFKPTEEQINDMIAFYNNIDAEKENVISEIQLEKSSEATSYEPYKQSQSLPIVTPTGLPAIPVPSGTSGITYTDADGQAWIADEIDFTRGKYIQRVWQAEFDGSEDERWFYDKGSNGFAINGLMKQNVVNRACISNKYLFDVNTVGIIPRIQTGWRSTAGDVIVVIGAFTDIDLDDKGLGNFKADLAATPLKVMTYLDAPIETDLSPELIAAYKQIHTNKPTTIVSNDADAQMDVSYAIDTKTYIDNKFAELASAIVSSASESE